MKYLFLFIYQIICLFVVIPFIFIFKVLLYVLVTIWNLKPIKEKIFWKGVVFPGLTISNSDGNIDFKRCLKAYTFKQILKLDVEESIILSDEYIDI